MKRITVSIANKKSKKEKKVDPISKNTGTVTATKKGLLERNSRLNWNEFHNKILEEINEGYRKRQVDTITQKLPF